MKPGFHGARTHWNPGSMAFQPAAFRGKGMSGTQVRITTRTEH